MRSREIKIQTQTGFTIVEMMISITVFLIAVALAYQIMQFGMYQRNTVNTRVDAVKAARIGLNYIRRDVVNAGLGYHNVGGLVPDNFTNKIIKAAGDADADQDFLTSIIVGNNVSNNLLNPAVPMDAVGTVARDLTFNGGNDVLFTGTAASGSSVVVQVSAADIAKCNKYDLYLFVTGTSQIVGLATAVDTSANTVTLEVGAADPIGVNAPANGTAQTKSALIGTGVTGSFRKIILTTYSVDNNGNLIRQTYGNQTGQPAAAQIDSKPLISNVKDFQIMYLLANGTFTSDPTNGNDGRTNQQQMNNVIEVEITLTVIQTDNSQAQSSAPIQVKEVISTRNLLYKSS